MKKNDYKGLIQRGNKEAMKYLRDKDMDDETGTVIREIVENLKVLLVEVERLTKDNAEAQKYIKTLKDG